jgi:hypothetical protein
LAATVELLVENKLFFNKSAALQRLPASTWRQLSKKDRSLCSMRVRPESTEVMSSWRTPDTKELLKVAEEEEEVPQKERLVRRKYPIIPTDQISILASMARGGRGDAAAAGGVGRDNHWSITRITSGAAYSCVSHTADADSDELKVSQESTARGAEAELKAVEDGLGLMSWLESRSMSFHLMRWEGPPEMKLTTFSGFRSK